MLDGINENSRSPRSYIMPSDNPDLRNNNEQKIRIVKSDDKCELLGIKSYDIIGSDSDPDRAKQWLSKKGLVIVELPEDHSAVAVKVKDLADKLQVRSSVVKQAAKNNSVRGLIDNVKKVTSEEVAALRADGHLSKRDATAMAAVIHELQSDGTVLGKRVESSDDLSAYARRKDYKIPLSVEKGASDEVFVHLKEHGTKRIGKGGFGKVTKTMRVSDDLSKPELTVQKTQRSKLEAAVDSVEAMGPKEEASLRRVQGIPYVIKMYQAGKYSGTDHRKNDSEIESDASKPAKIKHGIVLEHCDAGALSKSKLKKMPPSERWELFVKILEGAHGIHERGLVHRDFKPDNILLKHNNEGELEPRIIDFGLTINQGEKVLAAGTFQYMPPDVWGRREQPRNHPAVDVWALGCIGLEIFAGVKPPVGRDILEGRQYMDDIAWDKIENPEVREILKEMLSQAFSSRLTLRDAIDRLTNEIKIMRQAEGKA